MHASLNVSFFLFFMFLELQLEMRFIEPTTMAKTLAGNFDIYNSHFTRLLVAR